MDISAEKRTASTRLFLLDMDGTVYIENDLVPGAREFIDKIRSTGRDYVFITNNSSKSSSAYIEKLEKIGLPADKTNIFTSGQAAAIHLKNIKKKPRIYLVGTKSLKNELISLGIDVSDDGSGDVDFLLVGYDTELEYKKLEIACNLLCENVPFYATNPDVVCPAKNGRYLPDCQTICNMLEKATDKEPFYIGKPRKEMAYAAISFKNGHPETTALVGDRLYTDIACGKNADILSILVLSGESTEEDIPKFGVVPDIIFDNVGDIAELL